MSKTQQIAKLEKLLARVSQRASQPRALRVVSAQPAAAPAPTAAATAPVVPPTPPRAAPPAPAPKPAAPPSSSAELPDLDFVESTAASGERRPSLVPAGSDESEQEFDIPAHGAPQRVQQVQAIDLETTPEPADAIEIDRAPLAVMTIPPAASGDEHAIDLEGPGRVPKAAPVPAASTLSADDVEEIEPEPSSQHVAAQSQRYASAALPATDTTRVVPMSPPVRARTFRELVSRTLALKPRR
jgi:hypothetical protein